MSLYVDTSVLYAAIDKGDLDHRRAKLLLTCSERLVLSDHVLVECWTLTRNRLGRSVANQFWQGISASGATVALTTDADLSHAWSIGESFPDQAFSMVDLTSFAVMLRLGVVKVASLDHHFAVFRFGPRRSRAFEVVSV